MFMFMYIFIFTFDNVCVSKLIQKNKTVAHYDHFFCHNYLIPRGICCQMLANISVIVNILSTLLSNLGRDRSGRTISGGLRCQCEPTR